MFILSKHGFERGGSDLCRNNVRKYAVSIARVIRSRMRGKGDHERIISGLIRELWSEAK
jgi:hypothetical protein